MGSKNMNRSKFMTSAFISQVVKMVLRVVHEQTQRWRGEANPTVISGFEIADSAISFRKFKFDLPPYLNYLS